jgi:hypothetical protein
MWSVTSQRERRTGDPENFQPSAKKDFFNTIRQERSFAAIEYSLAARRLMAQQHRAILYQLPAR